MSNLIRWNPRRDVVSMSDAIDRLFDNAFIMPFGDNFRMPSVDLIENNDHFLVKAELPGFKPEDIDIHIEGTVLMLSGKLEETKEDKKEGQYHVRERRQGGFQRAITLPTTVDTEKADANFENGVLTLKLPKHEAAMPKKIAIQHKK